MPEVQNDSKTQDEKLCGYAVVKQLRCHAQVRDIIHILSIAWSWAHSCAWTFSLIDWCDPLKQMRYQDHQIVWATRLDRVLGIPPPLEFYDSSRGDQDMDPFHFWVFLSVNTLYLSMIAVNWPYHIFFNSSKLGTKFSIAFFLLRYWIVLR